MCASGIGTGMDVVLSRLAASRGNVETDKKRVEHTGWESERRDGGIGIRVCPNFPKTMEAFRPCV